MSLQDSLAGPPIPTRRDGTLNVASLLHREDEYDWMTSSENANRGSAETRPAWPRWLASEGSRVSDIAGGWDVRVVIVLFKQILQAVSISFGLGSSLLQHTLTQDKSRRYRHQSRIHQKQSSIASPKMSVSISPETHLGFEREYLRRISWYPGLIQPFGANRTVRSTGPHAAFRAQSQLEARRVQGQGHGAEIVRGQAQQRTH